MGDLTPIHLLIIVGVLFLLFGASRLPAASRALGQSLRIFKAETKGLRTDEGKPAEPASLPPGAVAPPVPPAQYPAPQYAPPVGQPQYAPPVGQPQYAPPVGQPQYAPPPAPQYPQPQYPQPQYAPPAPPAPSYPAPQPPAPGAPAPYSDGQSAPQYAPPPAG